MVLEMINYNYKAKNGSSNPALPKGGTAESRVIVTVNRRNMTKNCPFCDSVYITNTVPVVREDCGAVGPVRNVTWDEWVDKRLSVVVESLEDQIEYLNETINNLKNTLGYYR